MNVVVGLLMGTDAHSRTIAVGAARRAFVHPRLLEFASLEDALMHDSPPDLELLLVANLDEAAEWTEAGRLPRWTVVTAGEGAGRDGLEIVPLEDWTVPLLARVFRLALAQHRLRRENDRLRGDLRTIAHRVMHDLRTPLGGILSAGEALKEVLAERGPASPSLTKPLFDSVDDMKRVMEQVIALTKATADPALKGPVNMGEVVFRALQRLDRQILAKNAVVTQPPAWPEVEGVPVWLESIWSNLLGNALQHGKSAPRLDLGWRRLGSEFRFWIADDSSRVPPERRRTLFQPFHLLHQSNARRGLGLSVVERLVELQGGGCGYETMDPDGSRFFFTLPARQFDQRIGAREDAESARTGLSAPTPGSNEAPGSGLTSEPRPRSQALG